MGLEVIPLTYLTSKKIEFFLLSYIIFRYEIPMIIIIDNGLPFKNQEVHKLCDQFHIQHLFATPYYPQSNGQADVNKMILNIFKKVVNGVGQHWHLQLNPILWVYRTCLGIATAATPYSLVSKSKAILPIELELPFLCVSFRHITSEEDYRVARL